MFKARKGWAAIFVFVLVLGGAGNCYAKRTSQNDSSTSSDRRKSAQSDKNKCTYVAFKGMIKIVSIDPREPGEGVKKDEREVRFVFEPLFPQGNPTVKISGEPFVMIFKDGKYPTDAYVNRNEIEVGSTHEATLNALQKGSESCASSIFDFTGFKR